ncbi:MAG: hypothetical protein O7G30_07635 [Proteobacteria bacterium]|nr:hypothetical protein [Pseudomonadota bacterium]
MSADQFSRALLGLLLIAAFALGACSNTPEVTQPADVMPDEFAGAPGWVVHGCGAIERDDDDPDWICGVGSMGGTRNIALARTTAVARGRTEIAGTLEVRVIAMLKDYAATTTGGEEFGHAATDEQHRVDVSRQVTDFTLAGTELRETWISRNGTLYALVVLDVARFLNSVGEMEQLAENLRKAIQQRARKSFKELRRETVKGAAEGAW